MRTGGEVGMMSLHEFWMLVFCAIEIIGCIIVFVDCFRNW